ncbi:MAG TPA: hypothetical protein DHV51_01485 [Opitutae bacterium]|nr:hypothetical protein [Opitutae bacterium]
MSESLENAIIDCETKLALTTLKEAKTNGWYALRDIEDVITLIDKTIGNLKKNPDDCKELNIFDINNLNLLRDFCEQWAKEVKDAKWAKIEKEERKKKDAYWTTVNTVIETFLKTHKYVFRVEQNQQTVVFALNEPCCVDLKQGS